MNLGKSVHCRLLCAVLFPYHNERAVCLETHVSTDGHRPTDRRDGVLVFYGLHSFSFPPALVIALVAVARLRARSFVLWGVICVCIVGLVATIAIVSRIPFMWVSFLFVR